MNKLKTGILLIASALSVGSCGGEPTSPQNAVPVRTSEVPPSPVDELAFGRSIYEQACSRCHKQDGSGGEVAIDGKTLEPADLRSEHVVGITDDEIIATIYNGKTDKGMPAFRSMLGEAQIREVVTYIRRGIQDQPASTLQMKPAL